jgi:hypothetical protein
MADVKTISGVFTGAYAEHPLPKSQFRFDWGLCLQDTEQVLLWFLVETKEIMLC